ncbi:MAG: leucine-rich repeat protein [Oscillospiraceae bacterium]
MNCADLTTATVNGTKLDRYMFWYCTGLTTLIAPNVTEIDECALGYCVKLTSLPLAKVTSIGNGAFRNCHGLTAVTIPGSVRSFGKYVFADCGNLSSVTFVGNANVTSLPEGTFYECVKLKEVHLGDGISQTEGLSLYMAGWSNDMKADVYCNQPEEYFFRNEFDTCFIDLGNQQFDSENKEKTEITYIWTNTTYNNGELVYHFKAASSGGCGGGGCGGGAVGADGMAEYTMSPSVNAVFHYAAADQGAALANLAPARASALYSALPTVLTVEVRDKKSNQITETYEYTLSDLEGMAQTTLAGYQYVGMKGWAVMAATEYVTIDDLIGGEPLTGTDTITLYAGEGATYSATGADLQQNSYFFPASSYTNSKVTSPATPVPAIIALEWNTGKIETTPDSSALDAVARTAYKPTNLRFAHGLSAANYTALDDCDSMQTGDVCSAMRMLQRVQKIVVTMDVQKDAQITVPAVISGTNATVDSSKMSDALDKLADNGLLTVDASNSSSTGLSFTLPSADVRKLADKNVKLELITALGSVTLDAASLKGFGGGLFRPNAPITREQFVAILYRYAAYKGLQTTASASLSAFADAASVSGWAVDAVRWAVGSGMMNGKNGRIDPAGLTTRAEAAALLHRCLA